MNLKGHFDESKLSDVELVSDTGRRLIYLRAALFRLERQPYIRHLEVCIQTQPLFPRGEPHRVDPGLEICDEVVGS